MNRHKLVGMIFVFLGIILVAGSAYAIISYASDMLDAVVDFVTTNNFSRLQECGVEPPSQLQKLKADLTTVILPSLYVGLPLLLLILSVLMFLGGFYYHKGRHKEEQDKSEKMENEVRRAAARLRSEETPRQSTPAKKSSKAVKAKEEPEQKEEEG